MPRRDPPRRKQEKAEDLARHLLSLQRTRGALFADAGGVWLLGRPSQRVASLLSFAVCLLRGNCSCAEIAGTLGCEEISSLEPARLAKWQWALSHLEGRRDLEDLIREGVRPLRGYRGIDFQARLQQYRQSLESFKGVMDRAGGIVACQDVGHEDRLDVAMLVDAATARLRILGAWPIDPVERLSRRDLPADKQLLAVTQAGTDLAASALATILLGLRTRRAAPMERQRLGGQLPTNLLRLFHDANEHSPVLQALAHVAGRGPLTNLTGIPEHDRESIVLASERSALLFGVEAGLRVLNNLARPWESAVEQSAAFHDRLRRLTDLVSDWQHGRAMRVRSPVEAVLAKNLRQVALAGQGGARLFTRLFVAWATGDEHGERLIGVRSLTRIAQAAWSHGPLAAVAAIAEAWQKEVSQRGIAASPSSSALRARLALTLAHPDIDLPIPTTMEEKSLVAYADWLPNVTADRTRDAWPLLVAVAESGRNHGPWAELVRTSLPIDVLMRIVRLGVEDQVHELCARPRMLVRYLDCVEALQSLNLPDVHVESAWLASLFRAGPTCTPGVVLTLLRRTNGGGTANDRAAALRALSQDLVATGPLAEHARTLSRALEAWDTPEVIAPPNSLPRLAGLLGVKTDLLVGYLHHRRLTGQGETFARGLQEPLEQAEREAAEADFLRRRLAQLPADAPRRAHLQERLSRLEDPAQAAGRLADSGGRARQRLERSLELLRQESLERTLDDVYRTYLARLLGKTVRPGPLPAGMREALALLHAPHIDTGLLLGFLDDVLEGRSLCDRAVNQSWLERAEARGINTACWLAGVRATTTVAGELITFTSERNALQILRMGSYFETCLTLESGCNSASTLMNALDVNKQVIYGRRNDGSVVARKLIGATVTGELAGYTTYAHENSHAYRAALGSILVDFAGPCRLRLSDQATPETLHSGFWYDDGNETWTDSPLQPPLPAPPAGEPQDSLAAGEWHLAEALRLHDRVRLIALLGRGNDETAHAALFRLLLDPPGENEPAWTAGNEINVERVIGLLTQSGSFAWLEAPPGRLRAEYEGDRLCRMVMHLPYDRAYVEQGIKCMRQMMSCRKETDRFGHETPMPSPSCAMASVKEIIELYEILARFGCEECLTYSLRNDYIRLQWVRRLQMAWLRDGNARPLVRAMQGDVFGLSTIVGELAIWEVIPGMATALRSALTKKRNAPEQLALALGTQGQPGDGPRLLDLLRDQPRSLELALAAVRTGHSASADEARRIWRPCRLVPDDSLTLSRLRELASPVLARQLRGEIKDIARVLATPIPRADPARCGELRKLLLSVALLGQPGPDGEPEALLGAYAGERAFREECHWYESDGPRFQRLWEEICRIDEKTERLAAGESEPLAWWGRLREQIQVGWDARLRDERFERVIRRIAAEHRDPRHGEALAAWIDLAKDGDREQIALLASLLRDDLDNLPWSIRDQAALNVVRPGMGDEVAIPEILVWLRGRRWGRSDGLLETEWQLPLKLNKEAGPALLLALESGDSEVVCAGRTLLDAHARHAPRVLLEALDTGFLWSRPEVIEPLADELARALSIEELSLEQVDAWILEPAHSYRWHRLLIEVVRPRFEHDDTDALKNKLVNSTDHPRALWLLALLAKQGKARSLLDPLQHDQGNTLSAG